MVTIQRARELAWEKARPLRGREEIPLTSSIDRILAEDIRARFDIPPFDRAAMDGYALRATDTAGSSAKRTTAIKVVDELKAGDSGGAYAGRGEAVSIMTGARMPSSCDSVIMMEKTREYSEGGERFIRVPGPVTPGDNVGKKGEDLKKGHIVLKRGRLIDSSVLGMLSYLGRERVNVYRKPAVAILATGNEIIRPGAKIKEGGIYDANSYLLYGQVLRASGKPRLLGIGRDDYAKLSAKIMKGLKYDMLILSGGVSVGKYDIVVDVLKKAGVEMIFWKVAVKPGKPTFFGKKGKTLVFGLPGYPVSTFLNFDNIVKVALARMAGRNAPEKFMLPAVLRENVKSKGDRDSFIRMNLIFEGDEYFTAPYGRQKSGVLTSVIESQGVLHLKKGESFKKGEKVMVELLEK